MLHHVRKNAQDFLTASGLRKTSLKWSLWQVYGMLNSVSSALSHLPNKQDSWISASGKVYHLAREVEAYTGALFDHATWHQVEADAKGLTRHNLPLDFFFNSPAIQSVAYRPRGNSNMMIEYTTTHTIFVPAFRNESKEKGLIEQNDQNTVYAKSEADFDGFVDSIWDSYQNRMFVDRTRLYDSHWGHRLNYAGVVGTRHDIVDEGPLIDDLEQEFRSSRIDNETRVWLLVGKPGTGKTTAIQHLANRLDVRFMHLSYNTLESMKFEECLMAKPDFLLLDDFDQLHVSICKEILDRIGNLRIPCFITANKMAKFDDRVLRPERIDRIIEFELPSRERRKNLIDYYVSRFKGPTLTEEQMTQILDLTEGLGNAHCKEVGWRLCRWPYAKVVKEQEVMNRLQKSTDAAPVPAAEAPAATSATPATK